MRRACLGTSIHVHGRLRPLWQRMSGCAKTEEPRWHGSALKAATKSADTSSMVRARSGLGNGICPDEETFDQTGYESSFTFSSKSWWKESLKGWKNRAVRVTPRRQRPLASPQPSAGMLRAPLGIHTGGGPSWLLLPARLPTNKVKMLQELFYQVANIRHTSVSWVNVTFSVRSTPGKLNDYRVIGVNRACPPFFCRGIQASVISLSFGCA